MSFTERVGEFSARHEAELAKGYLDDAGIESMIDVDDAGGNLGMTLDYEAFIVVRSEDAARARDVLTQAGMLDDENTGSL